MIYKCRLQLCVATHKDPEPQTLSLHDHIHYLEIYKTLFLTLDRR